MPARPSNISGVQDLLNVINQSVRELHIRIDQTQKQVPVHKLLKTSARLNFGSIGANSTVERSAALAGVTQIGTVHVSPQLTLGNANLVWSAYVKQNGQITVRLLNPTSSPVTPNTVNWNLAAVQ